jgi:HEAT repeat protein
MGTRKSHIAAQSIYDVADDPRQHPSVRHAALAALAAMCRKDAVPLLYKMALRAGPAIFPTDRDLGLAALRALSEIGPDDLAERLAPLLAPETPHTVRALAKRALSAKRSCR